MAGRARVLQSEALRDFRSALAEFADAVTRALGEVESDVQRMSWWLSHERPAYWKAEVRRREDRVNTARGEIARKRLIAAPEPASVVEERKALEVEERRLASALARQEATRRWAAVWDHEAAVYKGSSAGLTEVIHRDLPRAMERLARMAATIEAYERIAPPPGDGDAVELGVDLPASMEAAPDARRLRESAPIPPPSVAPGAFPLFAGKGEGIAGADAAGLERLANYGPALADGDIVTIQRRALASGEFIVHRREPEGQDSGWVIGLPGARADSPPGGWVRVEHGEIVAHRPFLAPLLRLAPGSLAVISRARIVRILDAQDRDLWTTGEGM